MSPNPADPSLAVVHVLDTSAIIAFKKLVPIVRQWEFLEGLSSLIREGRLSFPVQVRREMTDVRYPDAPGAWVAGQNGTLRHPQPSDEVVAEVLRVCPTLIEADAEDDVADPYVVAMALVIARRLPAVQVCVATDDRVDHLPVKSAMSSACDVLGVPWCTAEDFVEWALGEIEWVDAARELGADADVGGNDDDGDVGAESVGTDDR